MDQTDIERMMLEPPRKRQRSANYTAEEKNTLLNLIFQEKHIIECKKTDAVTWREKEASWGRVAKLFNSICPAEVYRPASSLKKCYENQRKHVRKQVGAEKSSARRTGGGRGYFLKEPTAELTLALMNEKTVVGLENNFDSDRPEGDCTNNSEDQTETIVFEVADVDEQEENIQPTSQSPRTATVMINPEAGSSSAGRESQDWGNYTPQILKTPVNEKLKMVHTPSEKLKIDKGVVLTPTVTSSGASHSSWSARRRPVTSSLLHSSDITKQYTELSAVKLELATLELQTMKANAARQERYEEVEHTLRKKCLQLDLQIKQALLNKTNTLKPIEVVQNLNNFNL